MDELRRTISSMAVAREFQMVSALVRVICTRDRNGCGGVGLWDVLNMDVDVAYGCGC